MRSTNPAQLPSDLRARILASAAVTPSRTRSEGRRRAAVAYGAGALVGILHFEAWGGLAHSAGRPRVLTVSMAFGAVVLAVASSAVGWWRGSMVGRPAQVLWTAPLLVPAITLAWLFAFHNRYVEPFARVGYRCLGLSLVAGGALLCAAVWLRRGTVVQHAPLAGAALGATAGAWSAVLVDLWCPLTNVPHSLVGHVLPIVILAGLGALLGKTTLRLRAPQPRS
jgi:hypothetical protein